jgi:hypothetical protein
MYWLYLCIAARSKMPSRDPGKAHETIAENRCRKRRTDFEDSIILCSHPRHEIVSEMCRAEDKTSNRISNDKYQ